MLFMVPRIHINSKKFDYFRKEVWNDATFWPVVDRLKRHIVSYFLLQSKLISYYPKHKISFKSSTHHHGTISLVPHLLRSRHCNSFEAWAPVDSIYGCPIFKWSCRDLTTWHATKRVDPAMNTRPPALLPISIQLIATGRCSSCSIFVFWNCTFKVKLWLKVLIKANVQQTNLFFSTGLLHSFTSMMTFENLPYKLQQLHSKLCNSKFKRHFGKEQVVELTANNSLL